MGITREGANGPKFAALTNIRAPGEGRANAPSRGELVADFLKSSLSAPNTWSWSQRAATSITVSTWCWATARPVLVFEPRRRRPAQRPAARAGRIYGVSNGLLDAPWPKVTRTKAQFASLLCQGAPEDAYFEMLADTTRAPDMRCRRPACRSTWSGCCRRCASRRPGMGRGPRRW
jgi:uncharacterized protein with NRDE domain